MSRGLTKLTKVCVCSAAVTALASVSACGVEKSARAAQRENDPETVMLRVTQDESTLEREIGAFLSRRDAGINVVYGQAGSALDSGSRETSQADEYVLLFFQAGSGLPDFRVFIDTNPSATDASAPGRVPERAIAIRVYTGTYVRASRRADAHELICTQSRRTWAGTYWIDTDDELVCNWVLNVTPAGLPAESIYDALVRIVQNWREFGPLAKPVLDFGSATRVFPAPTAGLETRAS